MIMTDNRPQAIIEAEARVLAAEQAAQAEAIATSDQPEPTADTTQNVEVEAEATNTEFEALKAREDELRKEFARTSGVYGEELKKLRQALTQTQEMNVKLIDKLATGVKASEPAPINDDTFNDISPDVSENIGADTTKHLMQWVSKTIDQVVRREVANSLKTFRADIVEKEIKPIYESSKQSEASINNELFLSTVEKMAPGFRTVNGNQTSGEPSDPKWDLFLKTPVPDLDITWVQFFENSNRDPKVAAAAYKRFMQTNQKAPIKSAENQVAPSAVKARTSATQEKPVLRLQDYETFKNNIRHNPTMYSPEKTDEMLAAFTSAIMEGRLK
jgi:hypothetical protein